MVGRILLIAAGVLLAALFTVVLIGERGWLVRPSTWSVVRLLGWRNLFTVKAIHGYVYGRWTKPYMRTLIYRIMPRLDARGAQWWTDHYHAKVLTHEHAAAIILLNHDIAQPGLEQIIPYPAARDVILNGPPDVVAYECVCRHARPNPCQPTQVCMVIGTPFTDFILEHHPRESRRLTQAEALDLLRAEHERAHVHAAWFKDTMNDRFYAICNCCKCCCGGIEMMVTYGKPMISASGYAAQVDAEHCISCGACVESCPFAALSIAPGQAAVVEWAKCMGCGVCSVRCPADSIALVRDERKGVPLDVRLLH